MQPTKTFDEQFAVWAAQDSGFLLPGTTAWTEALYLHRTRRTFVKVGATNPICIEVVQGTSWEDAEYMRVPLARYAAALEQEVK